MRIAVAGIGYVGLTNAVLLAQNNPVIALDIDAARVELVNARQSPIADPELEEFLRNRALDLSATVDAQRAYSQADYVIVATPTNYDPLTHFFDTSSVEAVIEQVSAINPSAVIVIKSTIPVGFVEQARARFASNNIIFSPEFLREGRALFDDLHPSRIIVGERSERAKVFANLLLEGAQTREVPLLFTDAQEAEAIKLFANSYLDMRVGFLMSWTAMPWRAICRHARSLTASASMRALGAIITTRLLAMAGIACRRTASNCLQILPRSRKISFKRLWMPMTLGRRSWPRKFWSARPKQLGCSVW